MSEPTKASEGVLFKIRKLLEKAAASDYGPESEAFFAKADELMLKFAVQEFELAAADPNRKHDPEIRDLDMPLYGELDYEFLNNMLRLFKVLAMHVGVREIKLGQGKAKVVGWPEDLDFLEMLFSQMTLDLFSNMQPRWDFDKPEGDNLHAFKSSGHKWADIWNIYQKALHPDAEFIHLRLPWERKHGVRWTSVYKKWADANGVDRQMSSNLKYYRSDFGFGYVNEISARLRDVRKIRDDESEGGLVLVSRKSKLDEFMDVNFPPPLRAEIDPNAPKVRLPKIHYRSLNQSAASRGRAVGSRADIGLRGLK